MTENQSPVTISIIGTGTGDGGGVAPTPDKTVAVTPGGQPDLLVQVIRPAVAIAVRFVHLFLNTFVGMILTKGIGTSVLEIDAATLISIKVMLIASLTTATVGLLKDLVTVFGRLEGKYPLATGSI